MNLTQKNGPIFIVGAPRSGTTLLQYMLRSHPRISMPAGESRFIVPLYRNASKFGDLRQIENVRHVLEFMYRMSTNFLDTDLYGIRFDIETLAKEFHKEGYDSIPGIIAGLFERNARGEGKARWGDKSPYYVLHLRTIIQMFPDAQVIHIIRDGRDCALSMLKRKYDLKVFNTYHAAKYWQQYVETGQTVGRELGPQVYLEVRYEDILADPIAEVKRICEFLGEVYSESVVNFKKSIEPGKTPFLQKPIQKDNVEKWRKLMTPWQIKIFESAAGDTLIRNGYHLATNGKPMPLLIRTLWRLHIQIMARYDRRFHIPR